MATRTLIRASLLEDGHPARGQLRAGGMHKLCNVDVLRQN